MVLSTRTLVERLEKAYGVAEWWPRDSSFEVAVGAILTQRTSWTNVQLVIAKLKDSDMMDPWKLSTSDDEVLHELLRSSGFYRQKSRYVRAFSAHIVEMYRGRMELMSERTPSELRGELLELEGIGPETADTIMLYALGMPSFVVDAYSFRLLGRLGIYRGRNYGHVKDMFEEAVGRDTARLSSVHAAIVTHCKEHCRVKSHCGGCPLSRSCPSKADD